jgi:hypothetical protein
MKKIRKITGFLLSALFIVAVITASPSFSRKGGGPRGGPVSGGRTESETADLLVSGDDLGDDLEDSGAGFGHRIVIQNRHQ